MKVIINLLKDPRGMTGLETAIILIAFVTVAAVFGYAVLSAGLFSAERGKETIYAGLNEARSNLELSGSVMARSDDNTNVKSIFFTVKNAIAGNPIDMIPCNGTSNASNKCVISLSTANEYINNVKWTKVAIGVNNGNDLLETGEQFEITVNLNDLGDNISLSENLTANDKFSLQVKPALGSTITIQRTLPASIGPIMDLDLMFGSGGAGNGSGGSTGGGTNCSLGLVYTTIEAWTYGDFDSLHTVLLVLENTGSTTIELTRGIGCTVDLTTIADGTITNLPFNKEFLMPGTIQPGEMSSIMVTVDEDIVSAGETFTLLVTPAGGSTLSITRTMPTDIIQTTIYLVP